jgi:6-phosphofructokinase 2
MAKIITLTLNPAIDKTTYTAKVVPEKKLSCTHPIYHPGGGGINVSRALANLGAYSTPVYLAGGTSGNHFQQLLAKEQIASIIVPIEGNTRTNLTVVEVSTGLQFRFGMVSPPIKESEWQFCLQILEQQLDFDYIIASGSIPPEVPMDFFGRVAAIAKAKNARLIIDTSGEALQQAMKVGVFMIKPNLTELSALYGKETLPIDQVKEAAQSIIAAGACTAMAVSMGPDGALLIAKDDYIHIPSPVVTVKSTVGAGDSMVAGIVYGLSNNWNWQDIIGYGVACGSAATLNEGTQLCKKEDVERLYAEIRAGDIQIS